MSQALIKDLSDCCFYDLFHYVLQQSYTGTQRKVMRNITFNFFFFLNSYSLQSHLQTKAPFCLVTATTHCVSFVKYAILTCFEVESDFVHSLVVYIERKIHLSVLSCSSY